MNQTPHCSSYIYLNNDLAPGKPISSAGSWFGEQPSPVRHKGGLNPNTHLTTYFFLHIFSTYFFPKTKKKEKKKRGELKFSPLKDQLSQRSNAMKLHEAGLSLDYSKLKKSSFCPLMF